MIYYGASCPSQCPRDGASDVLTFFSIALPLRAGVAVPGVNATGRGTSPVFYLRVGSSF